MKGSCAGYKGREGEAFNPRPLQGYSSPSNKAISALVPRGRVREMGRSRIPKVQRQTGCTCLHNHFCLDNLVK